MSIYCAIERESRSTAVIRTAWRSLRNSKKKSEQPLPSALATIYQVAITLGSGHCAICFTCSIS